MDLCGHKPTLVETVVCAPRSPPQVASMLEAALVYHNAAQYEVRACTTLIRCFYLSK